MKSVRWCGAIAALLVSMAVCIGDARAQTGCNGSATLEATLQFDPMAEYTDFYFPSEISSSCFGGDNTVVDGGTHSSQRVVAADDSSTIYYCYDGLAGPPEGDPACPDGGPSMPTLLAPDTSVNMNIAPPDSGEAFFRIFLRVQYRLPAVPPSTAVSLHYRWFETADDQPVAGMDPGPDMSTDAGSCDEPTAGSSSSPQVGMCSRCSSLGGDCPPDCCEGLMCGDNAVCCVPEGGTCAVNGDCCQSAGGVASCEMQQCIRDTSDPCRQLHESCEATGQCCDDGSHGTGAVVCEEYDKSLARCCVASGGFVSDRSDCCSATAEQRPANDSLIGGGSLRCVGATKSRCSAATPGSSTDYSWCAGALLLVVGVARWRRKRKLIKKFL